MSSKISLSDKEIYEALVSNLIKYNLNPSIIKRAVDKIIELGITIDVDQNIMKQNLQKLNRKYSQKLITDKANYEAIVASIRTALETF